MGVCLSGCFITPRQLQTSEIETIAGINATVHQQQPVIHPKELNLDMHGAIARALVSNRDLAAEFAGIRVSDADLQVASAEALPGLIASGGSRIRNNTAANRSEVVGSGVISSTYSTTGERRTLAGDLTFSWNILDFGLSYVRAGQAADKSLIAREQLRRSGNRIAEETRVLFMRAAALQKLETSWLALKPQAEGAMAGADRIARGGTGDPVAALAYQREVLATVREIELARRSLLGSDIQLKTLIGLGPNEHVRLVGPGIDQRADMSAPALGVSPDALCGIALRHRPEIRQLALEGRISQAEAMAATLSLLPGVNFSAGAAGDTSRYLLNGNWVSWGAQVSWNLLKLLQLPARRDQASLREEHLKARGLAAASAILMQVHVAHLRYAVSLGDYRTVDRAAGVQRRLLQLTTHQVTTGRASDQAHVKERLLSVLADARRDMALADVHGSYASLITAIGADPLDYGALAGADADTVRRYLDEAAQESHSIVVPHSNRQLAKVH